MKKQKRIKWNSEFQSPLWDPLGWYTGIPEDPDLHPVQDADDL